MITPKQLLEAVQHKMERLTMPGLSVFWFHVASNRTTFREELLKLCPQNPGIVPLVIRERGFDNSNAILSDLALLLEGNRSEFERVTRGSSLAVILLGAEPLRVAQHSSPMVLPEWFPTGGGCTSHVLIEDVTFTADGPINSTAEQVALMCAWLWSLERILCERLEQVHRSDHNKTNALLSYLRASDGKIAIESIIASSEEYRMRCKEPAAFRPGLKTKECFVAWLFALVGASSPAELSRKCSAVASALGLSEAEEIPHESLFAVMFRPTQQDMGTARTARNLVLTLYAVYQLMNAVAHAGEYGRYPINLIRSFTYDLQVTLSELVDYLETLSARRATVASPSLI